MTNKKTQHDSLNVEQTLISSEAFIDKYKKPIMYVHRHRRIGRRILPLSEFRKRTARGQSQ